MLLASQALVQLASARCAEPTLRARPEFPIAGLRPPKEAIGTAFEATGAASPVWFTVAEGILTEVFYPTVDKAQIGDLAVPGLRRHRIFSPNRRRDTII